MVYKAPPKTISKAYYGFFFERINKIKSQQIPCFEAVIQSIQESRIFYLANKWFSKLTDSDSHSKGG